jgi:CHRD domain
MKKMTLVAAGLLACAATGYAFTDEGSRRFSEFLSGLNEAANVVSTTGNGTFRATISRDGTEINYVLTFKELEGDVAQAHIHIGLPQNSGGIVLWLCDSDTNQSPVATTPACTQNNPLDKRSGEVSGTLTAADVQNLTANGIVGATATTPGEFAEVVALIKAGKTYVNVHSLKFPPGEIRSQLDNRGNDHNGHDGDHDR